MKKLNKLALLIATASLAATGTAFAAGTGTVTNEDNWKSQYTDSNDNAVIWNTGAGDVLCWRDTLWTPATANVNCDGALKPEVRVEPKPVVEDVKPRPRPETPNLTEEKVSYSADALFDFDKAVIKPAGKQALNELVRRIGGMDLEVVVATGHTDSTGPAAYNQKLSLRRAEAVKAYLVSQGVPAGKIFVEGKGEAAPIADNKTRQGRAQNRRVEIEVVGVIQVRR